MNQKALQKIVELISINIGFHIKNKERNFFESIIKNRLVELNYNDAFDYFNLLKTSHNNDNKISWKQQLKGQKEWNIIAKKLTNGESFFRDRGQFQLLEETIIPQIINKKRQDYQNKQTLDLQLKIWSSGCSMGQEPYSLAILLDRIIPDISQWNIKIIGTDINQDFLKLAKTGIYKDWSFRMSDPYLKSSYFQSIDKQWQVKSKIQKMITFCQDNIVKDNMLPAFCYGVDLILCRNVFIYFEKDSINKGLNKFYHALNPDGYLMTGHAELQEASLHGFKTLNFPTSIIYQKIENARQIELLFT